MPRRPFPRLRRRADAILAPESGEPAAPAGLRCPNDPAHQLDPGTLLCTVCRQPLPAGWSYDLATGRWQLRDYDNGPVIGEVTGEMLARCPEGVTRAVERYGWPPLPAQAGIAIPGTPPRPAAEIRRELQAIGEETGRRMAALGWQPGHGRWDIRDDGTGMPWSRPDADVAGDVAAAMSAIASLPAWPSSPPPTGPPRTVTVRDLLRLLAGTDPGRRQLHCAGDVTAALSREARTIAIRGGANPDEDMPLTQWFGNDLITEDGWEPGRWEIRIGGQAEASGSLNIQGGHGRIRTGRILAAEDREQVDHAIACGADPYTLLGIAAAQARRPPPLDQLPDNTPLTVAAGPGRDYEAWHHAAPGVWIGQPGEPTDDLTAEQMTAADVRNLPAVKAQP